MNEEPWTLNYFNYFTEIEEHFQKARGTSLFLLSPLDWALVETWKNAGIPLEAVLRGIDASFEKWRNRKSKTQMVNSLAYCSQAVVTEARAMAGTDSRGPARQTEAPFDVEQLRSYLSSNATELRKGKQQPIFDEIASALDTLASEAGEHMGKLEDLERRLSALEEKMIAAVRLTQTEDALLELRRELDLQLRPYRGKMTADQISMLERQFLERRLLETAALPRLSLFYLR